MAKTGTGGKKTNDERASDQPQTQTTSATPSTFEATPANASSTAGGLRIGGLSTVGYNTGDLIFQGNFISGSSIVRRIQETIEG